MMTRWIVPKLRRLVQALSLCVLFALPLFALYTHYKAAHAIEDLPKRTWRGAAIRTIDRIVDKSPRAKSFVDQTQGTIWSARIAGVSLSDPLAGIEAIVSSRSLYQPLLWSLVIPVAVSLLLGRVFCGWICPMNTLLELVDKGRSLLRWLEIKPADVRFSLRNKYVMLALLLSCVAVGGAPFLAMIYPPAVLSREVHMWVFGTALGLGAYLILGICAFELLVSRRWWCRYICPGGALYSLLGRVRLIRVHRDEQKCIRCGDCVRVCQFDLRPMLVETTGMECTNCASCIAGCNSGALGYWLVLPIPAGRNNSGSQGDRPAGDQNNLPREAAGTPGSGTAAKAAKTVVGSLLLVALLARPAAAHHILGLPHYSYKENYPQAPTLEYPASTGPYDVLLTSYPGKPVPGEPATLAFYIKNRQTNQPYDRPVTLRVLKTSTFGSNQLVYGPETHQPFDNQHKFTVTFPTDGEYVAELSLAVEGRTEVIPFLMIAGQPTATMSIVIALAIGLGMFLIVVRAIKVKRRRRQQTGKKETKPEPDAAGRAAAERS